MAEGNRQSAGCSAFFAANRALRNQEKSLPAKVWLQTAIERRRVRTEGSAPC
jgi:hypothetical protein